MSLAGQNIQTDYFIIAKIGASVFGQTEFMSLHFRIPLNGSPVGELRLIDRSGAGITGNESGSLMVFEFNNVSDDSTQKASSMTCMIDSIHEFDSNAENTSYLIKFTAGNSTVLNRITSAYTGTSTDSMAQVYRKFNGNSLNSMGLVPMNSSVTMSDTMTWRIASENMWDQLNSIVSHSYIPNDYVYWTWDDVNDNLIISSLGLSKKQSDRYVMVQDDSALGSTDVAKVIMSNPNYTKWKFSDITRSVDIGSKREQLYPNTVLAATDATKQVTGNLSNGCFSQTMQSMGDTNGTLLQSNTNMGKNVAYAPLAIQRHNKNNMHNMYTSAEDIRKYVYAMYSKMLRVLIHNNAGPPVGSKVTVLCIPNNYRSGGAGILDSKYSDTYIVVEKNITFTAIDVDHLGRTTPTSGRQRTVITLASDNFAGDGTENIKSVATTLKWV